MESDYSGGACTHEGGGLRRDHILIPTPAAGAEATFKLDARWDWKFLAISYHFAASAVVSTRGLRIRYLDPDGAAWAYDATDNGCVAGQQGEALWQLGRAIDIETADATNALWMQPLSPLWTPGGWQVAIGASRLDVADQVSNIRALVLLRERHSG